MSDIIYLRPHHILCINNFKGKGYSEEFVANMTVISNQLNSNSNQRVILVKGCDVLCSACPHNKNNLCETYEKVRMYDKRVLQSFNLELNKEYSWDFLKRLYFLRIKEQLINVCKECKWINICNQ